MARRNPEPGAADEVADGIGVLLRLDQTEGAFHATGVIRRVVHHGELPERRQRFAREILQGARPIGLAAELDIVLAAIVVDEAIEAIEAAVIVQDRRHGQPAPAAEWEASDRPQQIAAELMADVVGEDDAAHRAIICSSRVILQALAASKFRPA